MTHNDCLEEIFESSSALWWSPDGSYLAYLRTDETDVPFVDLATYDGAPYTSAIRFHYPKPGFKNPLVALVLLNIGSPHKRHVVELPEGCEYFTWVGWANPSHFSFRCVDRVQQQSLLWLYRVDTLALQKVRQARVDVGWLERTSVCG